ncbi:MAG: hypothetical protein RLZZ227_3100 [Pseudomonadota bacterium]
MNAGALVKQHLTRLRAAILRGSRLPTYLDLLVTLLVQWLFWSAPPAITQILDRLDNVIYDQRFNIVQGTLRDNEHKIVIIDYDEKSLEAEGQWPWSRVKIGDLVKRLADYGVLVVGFDVCFPEYERNLVSELQQRATRDPVVAGSTRELLPELEARRELLDADRYFAESMQATDVVLGFSFRAEQGRRSGTLPEPIFRMRETTSESISLEEQQGYIGNVDVLQNAAAGAGFFDTRPDIDGVIRRYPLFMQFQNRLYPSIALDMARLFYFETEFTPEIERDLLNNLQELVGTRMGQVVIPTDEDGSVLVPYIGPASSYPYISATDVLNGTLTPKDEELLFNSLALVGTTSVGLYDLRATPVQAV